MNKENYTGLNLSKWLQDKGFKGKSEYWWVLEKVYSTDNIIDWFFRDYKLEWNLKNINGSPKNWVKWIPAYDILNDLCVKYAKELFEEDGVMKSYIDRDEEEAINLIPVIIMKCLQQGKKEEAEKYLQESCLFNPKNK